MARWSSKQFVDVSVDPSPSDREVKLSGVFGLQEAPAVVEGEGRRHSSTVPRSLRGLGARRSRACHDERRREAAKPPHPILGLSARRFRIGFPTPIALRSSTEIRKPIASFLSTGA